ncbi:hypothetical protein BH09BAC1_BH09BAC1_28250 [soil metagenome]
MTTLDLFLVPIYLFILYALAYRHKSKHYKGHPLEPYFIPGLTIKIVGAFLFAMIYQFYYRGGDTFWFYQGIEVFFQTFQENPVAAVKMMFLNALEWTPDTAQYTSKIWWFRDDNSFMVIKIGGLFSLFGFGSYGVITIFFALFSFWGLWKLLKVFTDRIPSLHKEFATAILFIPSVFFWGSGIMKDTIMIGCMGLIVYSFYLIFYKKERRIKYFISLLLFSFIMLKIRSFVFFILAPTLLLSLYVLYSGKIKSVAVRTVVAPFLLSIMAVGSIGVISLTANVNARYNLESMEKRAYDTQWWHTKVQELEGDHGSGYSLGEATTSVPALAARFPLAVNVTLFRPYIWEVNGPIMLQAALESLLILVFALMTLLKVGPWGFVRYSLKDPLLAFSLTFAILYAFGVGVTSNNFGALVRYKIPSVPMFLCALYIIRYYGANKHKNVPVLDNTEK